MDASGNQRQPSHLRRATVLGTLVSTLLGVGIVLVGCALAVEPTVRILKGGAPWSFSRQWDAAHGPFSVGIDALSAFFLLPVLVLSPLSALFGGQYMLAYRGNKSLFGFWLFFNVFVASMVMVVLARTAVLFLLSWEIMSISAFFLVTFEHEQAEVRRAGWVYLIATHLGVAFLIATFVLLGRNAGGLEFKAFETMPALGPAWSGLLFVLALVGFGAKAGFVPFHVWLPEAHPAAPSHVSALMSGVMIKMGVYGLLRVLTFLGPPTPWWGGSLALLGLVTALVGASLAMQQRDIKRVLAYSSIENIGLIGFALGVGLWGLAAGLPEVGVLGLVAGLLHVWNHSLMKGLMFLAAGSVLHATGTRDMEKLGGLIHRMPWTGGLMVAGSVAICALPPANGFVSEWLLYLGLMRSGLATSNGHSLPPLMAVAFLALVGGLAAIAFVRLLGVVMLGSPRTTAAEEAHESSWWMIGPMLVLALLCLALAILPASVTRSFSATLIPLLNPGGTLPTRNLDSLDRSLQTLGTLNQGILDALFVVSVLLGGLVRWAGRTTGPTWGCGYVRPTARIQYTGRSFAELLSEHLLPRWLRPRTFRQAPQGLFPTQASFGSSCPDPISELVYEPFFKRCADRFARLRIFQQGKVHVYLLYLALTVVLALGWVSIRK